MRDIEEIEDLERITLLAREEEEDEEDIYNPETNEEGCVLVLRRVLHATSTPKHEEQRDTIFHTKCRVKDMVCSLIIDGGSCAHVASAELVEKLKSSTTKHPKPYRLKWLDDGCEAKVRKRVLIAFSIGNYQDEITCDVVPMNVCRIVLERP